MGDIAEDLDAKGGALSTAKDLFAGAVGGIAQVLVGQPFDIVKVRLQTGTAYTSALDAARTIYAKEGPLAFYKGTLTPLLGIGACVSIQFGAFGYAKRRLEAVNAARPGGRPDLGYAQYYAAGAFAGVANSVVSGPVEHVRIRLQTQPHGAGRLYAGPWDCVRTLSSSPAGVLGGLFRGQAVTVLREAQAYGMWFLSFEWMMTSEVRRRQQQQQEQQGGGGRASSRADIPAWKVALYGGLAGEVLWLGSYPFDVVKSKMQTDGLGGSRRHGGGGGKMRYKTMRDCFAQTWRAEGMRGFWKGIGPTLLRAMPVSACTFATVEFTMRLIS